MSTPTNADEYRLCCSNNLFITHLSKHLVFPCDSTKLPYQGEDYQNVINTNCDLLHMSRGHAHNRCNECQNSEYYCPGIDLSIMIFIFEKEQLFWTQTCSE